MDKLNWTMGECFNAVRALRAAGEPSTADADELASRLRGVICAMTNRAQQAGYSQEQIQQMTYAVVALIDEIALSQPGALRDQWSQRPLQLHYFNENTAGENFFGHLATVRAQPASADVLRVYYTCLLLGFRGGYAVRGAGAELSSLMEELSRQVAAAYPVPELLSPYGLPVETPFFKVGRAIPWSWVGVAACVLSVLLYLGLQVSLKREVTELARAFKVAV